MQTEAKPEELEVKPEATESALKNEEKVELEKENKTMDKTPVKDSELQEKLKIVEDESMLKDEEIA